MNTPISIPPELLHLKAQDLANRFGCSRQYIGKLKRKAQDLCVSCGMPATLGSECARHAKQRRKVARKKNGNKPWKPGKRGRPPLESEEASVPPAQ